MTYPLPPPLFPPITNTPFSANPSPGRTLATSCYTAPQTGHLTVFTHQLTHTLPPPNTDHQPTSHDNANPCRSPPISVSQHTQKFTPQASTKTPNKNRKGVGFFGRTRKQKQKYYKNTPIPVNTDQPRPPHPSSRPPTSTKRKPQKRRLLSQPGKGIAKGER